jgi:hypothetical protein
MYSLYVSLLVNSHFFNLPPARLPRDWVGVTSLDDASVPFPDATQTKPRASRDRRLDPVNPT